MLPDMKQKKVASFRQPTPDEQQILIDLNTRPVRSDEVQRFNELMAEHHYLKDGQLVGEHLRYVAEYGDQWLALAETFVDPHLYQGTAYKASGWNRLGQTAGWKRSAEDFYQKHERPKQIWVRELVPEACRKLCTQICL